MVVLMDAKASTVENQAVDTGIVGVSADPKEV